MGASRRGSGSRTKPRGKQRATRESASGPSPAGEFLVTATVLEGFEPLLVRELTPLGVRARVRGRGAVQFRGTARALARVLLSCRCADRMQLRLLGAPDQEQLAAEVAAFPWDAWLPPDLGLQLTDASQSPSVAAALPRGGGAQEAETDRPAMLASVVPTRDGLALTLHLSRTAPTASAEPPAAVSALALRAGGSAAGGQLLLLPPTGPAVLLEAVLLATGQLPRDDQDLPGLRLLPLAAVATEERAALLAQHESQSSPRSAARGRVFVREPHVERRALLLDVVQAAGVESAVQWLDDAAAPSEAGSSPLPHGLQVDGLQVDGLRVVSVFPGSDAAPARLPPATPLACERDAHELAARLREYRRSVHFVMTRGEGLETLLGRIATRHGCASDDDGGWRVSIHDLTAPVAAVTRGAAARAAAPRDGAADPFRQIVARNARLRRRWPERQLLNAYRLYDRELPEVPWAVDRYGDCLHITVYETHSAGDDLREAQRIHALVQTLGVDPALVFVKRKERRQASAQHEVQARAHHVVVVREGGLSFQVNLSDYVDTGLFLDHRHTRARVRELARGRRILNLFAYTGAFTVYAAAGEAAATTSVDTSQVYLDWLAENLRLNHLDGPQHQRVRADALEFLRGHPPGPAYDLAIVDPPTYSNRHRGRTVWEVQRDHVELLQALLPLMSVGGAALFSTNFRGFRMDPARLPGWTVEELTPASIPPDFHDRRIHRAFWLMA